VCVCRPRHAGNETAEKSRSIKKASTSKAHSRVKACRTSKARSRSSRVRSASSKTVCTACSTSQHRPARPKARGDSSVKAAGRSSSTKIGAAGSSKAAKTKRGVRSRSSSAGRRSKSRAGTTSTGNTSSKRRSVTGVKKAKRRLNCYSAYLKAQLANRKISKVIYRVTWSLSVIRSLCYVID